MKGSDAPFDAAELREAFRISNLVASQRAAWSAGHPDADPDKCRYCGRRRQAWVVSRIDGHAACIVTEDFKSRVGNILRSSTVSYTTVAAAIGVSPGIVRSWAYSAGVAGPLTHALRRRIGPVEARAEDATPRGDVSK